MKTEIAMRGCIKSDLIKVEEELRKRATDTMTWRLLVENVVRERKEEEQIQWKWKSRSTHPNDCDAKKEQQQI